MNPTLFDLLSEPGTWLIIVSTSAMIWGFYFLLRP